MSLDQQVSDNPYDPDTLDYQTQTLPLDQLFELALRKLELRLNVMRPAKVVLSKTPGRVDVQILLQAKYIKSSSPFTLPTIQDALVSFPRGASYHIRPPVAVGDTGMVIFCDRSLDSWSVSGGTVYPNDTRTHDISDAVFIPGLYPFSDPVLDLTTDLIFNNGLGEIRLTKSGKTLIGGKGADSPLVLGDKLKDMLSSIIAQLDTILTTMQTIPATITTTPGNPGLTNPLYAAPLLAAKTAIDLLKVQYLDVPATNILSLQHFTEKLNG